MWSLLQIVNILKACQYVILNGMFVFYQVFLFGFFLSANTIFLSTWDPFLLSHNQELRQSSIVSYSFLLTQSASASLETYKRVIVVLLWMETNVKVQGFFYI